MSDDIHRNRREDFRIDDVIKMREELLSASDFEARQKRTGLRFRMDPALRDLLDREVDADVDMQNAEVPTELVRAIDFLDSKLNYLISMNILKESDCGHLEDREVNISTMGMSFFTDKAYEVGKPAQITLAIPIFPPQVIELLAEVMWVIPRNDQQSQVGVGFRFRGTEEAESIARYVFARHREMLRLEEKRA